MEELLTSANLIELHENLEKFAKYHQNKGGQMAHVLIKEKLIDDASNARDGSPDALLRDEGYDKAIKQVLALLRDTFIP